MLTSKCVSNIYINKGTARDDKTAIIVAKFSDDSFQKSSFELVSGKVAV